jgi:fructose-specific phosphotransferase system IIC component
VSGVLRLLVLVAVLGNIGACSAALYLLVDAAAVRVYHMRQVGVVLALTLLAVLSRGQNSIVAALGWLPLALGCVLAVRTLGRARWRARSARIRQRVMEP